MMMQLAPHRTRALTGRVLRQLRADPRFVAASLIVPLIITFLLKVFFDAIDVPMFDQTRFAIPATAFIVHFVTYILTALVLVRERVGGTMERMFINGYRQPEIIGGYLGAYTVLATWQSLLILTWLMQGRPIDWEGRRVTFGPEHARFFLWALITIEFALILIVATNAGYLRSYDISTPAEPVLEWEIKVGEGSIEVD